MDSFSDPDQLGSGSASVHFFVVNLIRYLKCLFYLDLINVGLQQAWEGG